MFALFNLGAQEMVILAIMGLGCVGFVVALVLVLVLLSRGKRPPEEE